MSVVAVVSDAGGGTRPAEAGAGTAEAVPPEVQEELAQLRSRVAEGDEWQRKREAELELLRKALQRRDALLVSQRTSFYRELLSHQGYAKIASVGSSQPSVTLDEMHHLERLATAGQKAAERPAFFDACIFEAAHLELDEPLARKVTAALQAAAGREARLQAEVDALQARAAPATGTGTADPASAPAPAAVAAVASGRSLAADTPPNHRRLEFGQTDEAQARGGPGTSSDAEERAEVLQAEVVHLQAEIESLELRLMSSDGERAAAARQASARLQKELYYDNATL